MSRWSRLLCFAALILLAVSACRPAAPSAPSPTPTTPAPSPLPPTPTAEPSPTPQPPLVVLWGGDQADPALFAAVEPLAAGLAGEAGFRFEVRSDLAAGSLDENLRLVLALPPAAGLADLAAAAPAVQFIGVGLAEAPDAENISRVELAGDQAAMQGFLAGYISALITPDWRVGVIAPPGSSAVQGFVNGVIYYCGLCRPAYPPYNTYPQLVELSPDASAGEVQSTVDGLAAQAVETVFLASGVDVAALAPPLAQAGINLIGTQSPDPALEPNWVASIGADLPEAVRQAWAEVTDGSGGVETNVPLEVFAVNEELLSTGRQRLVQQVLEDLQAGFISP